MRSLFGISQPVLLWSILGLTLMVASLLGWAAVRNPLLPRLAWRNVPRRPGFAALITLGLTLGTVILSSAFTTGDTMSQSVRSVVTGVLGAADEVVFVPSSVQRSGFDLAQSIASGTLLTGITSYVADSEVQRVRDVIGSDPRVAAIVPIVLEQAPVASEAHGFRAQLTLIGSPELSEGFGALHALDGTPLALSQLGPDEVYLNSEAAAALGVQAGDTIRVFGLLGNEAEVILGVRQVARLGDLGGGQATIFLPIERLQALVGHPNAVNQILVVNRGDPAERLASSWPITVELRAAFMEDAAAERVFRALSAPVLHDVLSRAAASPDTAGRLRDKLGRLQAALTEPGPTPEFKALVQDPEVLTRIASRLPGVANRGNTPFAAGLAGGSSQFRVVDVQSIAQDQADRWGSAFTDLFVVLGSFSLFSGVLLIVLIFSLVALERRAELGLTRALGGRRRDVILLLALEGGVYSLISSLFGLGGGLGLAWAIIGLAQGLVEQYGFHLEPAIEPTSIAASYALGVVLTFIAVTATAWRSSRFSIVTAIRDLSDPAPGPPGWRSLMLSAAPAIIGPVLVRLAIATRWSMLYAAGVVVAIVGAALLGRWVLRRLGATRSERLVFTLAGLALMGWWALPLPLFPAVIELSFLSGIGVLLGAVWVVAYNVGLLRLIRGRAALWRLSTAYVAVHRFRTGLTLAMFGLVVLSLTLAAVMLTVTRSAYADPEAQTGGWDIRVESTRPPRDLRSELETDGAVAPDAFTGIGAASRLRVEMIRPGAGEAARWQSASVLVVDQGFTDAAHVGLVAGSPNAWRELTSRPGTAVVGAALLKQGDVAALWLRDLRQTRPALRVEVVGLADPRGPFGSSILVGDATLTQAGWPLPDQATYFLSVPAGANARELATGLSLSAPDLRATTLSDEARLVQGVRGLLNMILQGFMGVGLLAGVAALGTLSTRAVVERRRQIGILRALGFTARAISVGLLIESSVVALLGAGLGVGVGLFVARGTVAYLSRQNPELQFGVPWAEIGGVVALALMAALVMTLLPARQAARLTPAEALREV